MLHSGANRGGSIARVPAFVSLRDVRRIFLCVIPSDSRVIHMVRSHSAGTDRPAGWLTRWRQRGLPLLLMVAVFAVSLWQNLAAVSTSPFHPDESRWLNRAHYLADLLHPTGPAWRDQYLIRGQPPIGSYVTGLGLLLQGHDLHTNAAWVFERGDARNVVWNVVKGAMPSQSDLIAARRTSAVIGALTVAVLFALVTRLSNWAGGLVGALFLAFHPLQVYLASIGVFDALFTLIIALTTLSLASLATRPTWPRGLLAGVLLGIGAGTKLSPLFLALAFGAGGLALLWERPLRRMPLLRWIWRRLLPLPSPVTRRLGWLLLSTPVVATTTFVLTYPYLWPDPVQRTRYLFKFRQDEMANQARIFPWAAIESRLEALERTWVMLTKHYSTTGDLFVQIGDWLNRNWNSYGIDIPFAAVGLIFLTIAALRHGPTSSHFLVAAGLAGQCALILGVLRVDFDRYYLPIVFTFAVGIGYLAGQAAAWMQHARAAGRRRSALSRPKIAREAPAISRPVGARR